MIAYKTSWFPHFSRKLKQNQYRKKQNRILTCRTVHLTMNGFFIFFPPGIVVPKGSPAILTPAIPAPKMNFQRITHIQHFLWTSSQFLNNALATLGGRKTTYVQTVVEIYANIKCFTETWNLQGYCPKGDNKHGKKKVTADQPAEIFETGWKTSQ